MKHIAAIFLFIFLMGGTSNAATYTASTCGASDVQGAINSATSPGDIVQIPAGTCTWTQEVTFGAVDNLTIQGVGESDTIINVGWNPADGVLTASTGTGYFRITGIKFNTNQRTWTWGLILIKSSGDRTSFRIDHVTIDNAAGIRGVAIMPGTSRCQPYKIYGVIDHLTVNKSTTGGLQAVSVFGYCRDINYTTGLESGANAWTEEDMAGSDNAVYVEDSTFNYGAYGESDGVFDVYDTGRIVFRHNTVTGTGPSFHGFDSSLGNRWAEVYNNIFNNPVAGWNARGGGLLFFNNTCSGGTGAPNLMVYRATGAYGEKGQAPTAKLDGYPVGGTNYDVYGYPARYQPGRGQNNALSPVYVWNNTGCGTTEVMAGAENFVQINRDYYESSDSAAAKPGYTAYTYPHPLAGESPAPATFPVLIGVSLGGGAGVSQ